MVNAILIMLVVVMVMVLLIGILTIYIILSWNIPTIILRYQGDKRRPQIVLTKSRRVFAGGVWRLLVRGYKLPLRDFKAEHYYPSKKGKHGTLLLWEAKPGILTPVAPRRVKEKAVNQDLQILLDTLNEKIADLGLKPIEFVYDQDLYDALLVKAVDDTDIDWMLQEIARVDAQYTVGWRDFLAKHAAHIVLIFLIMGLLTGFIVWMEKMPELSAQCAGAATQSTAEAIKNWAVTNVVPPG